MAHVVMGPFAVQMLEAALQDRLNSLVQIAILILSSMALLGLHVLLGGTSPSFCIPCYGLMALAGLATSLAPRKAELPRAALWCLTAGAIFFGYVLLRGLCSAQAYLARSDIYMVLAALIIYLTVTLFLTSSRLRIPIVTVILLLGAANFVIAGIQFFKGRNFMPFNFLPRPDYGARASGFFGCPNHLAGFLEVAMLLGLALACWSRHRLMVRIAAGYATVICAVGIVLTGSRGGYASSIAGLVTFGFVSLLIAGKWLRREFWIALVATIFLALLAIGFGVRSAVRESEYLQYRVETVNLDVGVRKAMSLAAIQQFQMSPWIGTGSRTYLYYGRQFRDPVIQEDPTFAHNDYAQLLAEYGLFGVASMGLFLAFHIRSAWQSFATVASARTPAGHLKQPMKRSGKGSRSRSAWRAVAREDTDRPEHQQPAFKGSNSLALTAAAVSSVVAYMVHSLVDFNLHIPANACLMAFIFGILANPGTGSPSNAATHDGKATKRSAMLRWVPAALGLWLSASALSKWPAEYHAERARRLLSDWRLLDSAEIANNAAEFSRKGLERDPNNPELFYDLGESQIILAIQAEDPGERKRLYEESIASYQSALQLAPRDVRYVLCLAWSLDAIERFDEAETAFATAVQLDPNSGRVHSSYAAHYHLRGELEKAEAEYVRSMELWFPADLQLQQVRKEIAAKKAANVAPGNPAH